MWSLEGAAQTKKIRQLNELTICRIFYTIRDAGVTKTIQAKPHFPIIILNNLDIMSLVQAKSGDVELPKRLNIGF